MTIKSSLAAAGVLAAVIAVSGFVSAEAAGLANPGAGPHLASLAEAAKHRHHRRHSARSKRPGTCGENMYYSRKVHHCLDARDKA
jgi:hypothetical protein